MSKTVRGLVLDANGNEFSGPLTGLASFVSNDLANYIATAASPIQESTTGLVHVDLTDVEASRNYVVKFTSSVAGDLLVRYGNREELYARGSGEDTERDQRTGVRYPKSRMTIDGRGRHVADKHYIAPIEEREPIDLGLI